MLVIGATDLSRKIAVLLLVTSISSPLEAFAEQDRQCIADCTERGYQREFCDSRCSYSVPQNQSQPNSGVGDALNDLARTMGEDPYMRGQEDAARQALIKQQIENQRLQNEVLRRQLGGQGTPRSPQPVANTPEAPSQQPAATPQNGQDKQATKYFNEGNAAYTQKNYSDAFFFLRAAAELGNAGAQMNLAVLYYNGHGVPKDPVKAVEWLRKAAAQGYAPAISNLGWMYQNGWGVRQSYSQARELYQVAAEQGFAQACANLGYLYEKGIGVTQSYDEARLGTERLRILVMEGQIKAFP